MTLPATFFAYLIGLPLGVLLVITRKDGILPKPTLNRIIGVIVNLLRSVPFIILMVMLFPATRAILGRGTGTVSIIIPLTVSAFPYVARMVEGSLLEVDNGVVEAAQAMGSTTFQIVRKVLIPEAMPSLVNGFAICITTILGYTAMAPRASCWCCWCSSSRWAALGSATRLTTAAGNKDKRADTAWACHQLHREKGVERVEDPCVSPESFHSPVWCLNK